MKPNKEPKSEGKEYSSEAIRDKLNLEQVIMNQMERMGRMLCDPVVGINQYRNAMEHLYGLLVPYKDKQFNKDLGSLKKARQKQMGICNSSLYYARRDGSMANIAAANSEISGVESVYYRKLWFLLNELAKRLGIGLEREDMADFEGYRKFLNDKKLPGVPQSNYAIKLAQIINNNIFKEQRNWLALFMGKVGSGKSYSACALSKMFDPGFNLSRVCFDEDSFMRLVRSDLPPGSFIVCDEIGSWLGSREYMTTANRILSYVIQTFRNKRLGLFWTLPLRRQADINLRSMSDVTFETVDIWREVSRAIAKMKYTQINAMSGFEINPFPVLPAEDGCNATITRCLIPRPGKAFERVYEIKKKKWQDAMYAQQHKELQEARDQPRKSGMKPITKKEKAIRLLKKGKLPREIAKQLKTSGDYVRRVRSEL